MLYCFRNPPHLIEYDHVYYQANSYVINFLRVFSALSSCDGNHSKAIFSGFSYLKLYFFNFLCCMS